MPAVEAAAREIGFGSHTTDERLWIISSSSDVEPGETYLFDRAAKRLTLQYKIREKLPRETLAEMKPIRYKSSYGLEIPGYLTLPKGVPAKNLPLVVFPHGGPWGRDTWGYNPIHQFLANRGYAVLSMNFRGSTGYGRKFLNAGNQEWGQKMQDDIARSVKHLIADGTADPKRVGISGGSYGGYATLAGAAFTPDVYAAAVAIVAPSNLITLLDSIPPYWEPVRKMFHERMGNSNTAAGKAQMERQSPLNSASKITTPLMVVQGANDPRVNKRESGQIVIALRDRKFPVEYLVADDEGHGFARPVNNLAMFAALEKFFAKYLDGRFQSGMTPEVEKRLKELTVDPATAPVLGLMFYKAKIEAGPQTIALEIQSKIKDGPDGWLATDTMESAIGKAVDTALLDRKTLAVLKRSIKQGLAAIGVECKDGKATGKMNLGGSDRPINADLRGLLFADAEGANQALAALPLAEGCMATFRNFDIQRAKEKLMQLKVAGSQSVTVPAGTFDCRRVEISSADGGTDRQTLDIAKKERRAVKTEAVMAQMGGAKLTAEL